MFVSIVSNGVFGSCDRACMQPWVMHTVKFIGDSTQAPPVMMQKPCETIGLISSTGFTVGMTNHFTRLLPRTLDLLLLVLLVCLAAPLLLVLMSNSSPTSNHIACYFLPLRSAAL